MKPRLIALLSFYDERPDWLAACIFTMYKHLDVDHVVALDGAYALYPEGRAWSPTDQHHAITEACNALGVGLTLSAPQHVWTGNETEKRTALFRLADSVSTNGVDWYFVIDADELVDECRAESLKSILADLEHDVADVALLTREPTGEISRQPLRMLFRAIHGITVEQYHWHYKAPDGRMLWGNGPTCIPGTDLGDIVRVEHRHEQQRNAVRNQGRKNYYKARDLTKVELRLCDSCETEHGTLVVPQLVGVGTPEEQAAAKAQGKFAGRMDKLVCCDACAPIMIEKWEEDLRRLQVDPNAVEVGHAVGLAA